MSQHHPHTGAQPSPVAHPPYPQFPPPQQPTYYPPQMQSPYPFPQQPMYPPPGYYPPPVQWQPGDRPVNKTMKMSAIITFIVSALFQFIGIYGGGGLSMVYLAAFGNLAAFVMVCMI